MSICLGFHVPLSVFTALRSAVHGHGSRIHAVQFISLSLTLSLGFSNPTSWFRERESKCTTSDATAGIFVPKFYKFNTLNILI